MSDPLAPPEPTKLQRDIAARPSSWFVQSPLCIAAGLATAKYFFKINLLQTTRGHRVLAGSAFAYAVMTPFDVWYWRRARDAVVDRDGWEMRQKRMGYPVPAPRGVRGEDGEWTAETTTETATSSGSGNVTAGRLGRGGGGGSEGARSQGGYSGTSGTGGEEELQDPWALPQSKKGGSSRWS